MLEVRLMQEKDRKAITNLSVTEGEDFTCCYTDMLDYYYDFEVEHMYGIFVFGELAGLATTGYNDDYYTPDEKDFERLSSLGLDKKLVDDYEGYLIISNVYVVTSHRGKSLANCLIEHIIQHVGNACVIHPIHDKIKEYYLRCDSIFESNYEPTILLGVNVK